MSEKSDLQTASSQQLASSIAPGRGSSAVGGLSGSDGPVTVVNPERADSLHPRQPLLSSSVDSVLLRRLFPQQDHSGSAVPVDPLDDIVMGHFRIEERIGSGGMGAVFRAFDERLERVVALKVLAPSHSHDHDSVERFRNEARAAARLDHDNIARVHFNGEDQGLHFITFEYVTGTNLREMIRKVGRLEPAEAVNYTLQIATALKHTSSAGVVHRDIKPSNIIVTPAGRAKLVDLGLARKDYSESANELTVAGTTLGTFDYISPEQAKDPRDVDVRSDIYSLGCTLYHLLTGEPPYPDGTFFKRLLDHQDKQPPNPARIAPNVSPALAAVVQKMMASDPGERYATPDDLIRDFMLIAGHMGLQGINPEGLVWATSQSTSQSFWQRHLGLMISAAALLLLVFFIDRFPGIGPKTVDQPEGNSHVALPGENSKSSSEDGQLGLGKTITGSGANITQTKVTHPSPLQVNNTVLENFHKTLIAAVGIGPGVNFAQAHHPSVIRPPGVQGSGTGAINGSTGNKSPRVNPKTAGGQKVVLGVAAPRSFTVLSNSRSETKSFRTLEAACTWAKTSDVIVLSFNGTRKGLDGKSIFDHPVQILNKKLTIRAANGFRPQIEFVAQEILSEGYQTHMITVSGGSVDLFNVDLVVHVDDEIELKENQRWALFSIHDADRVKLDGVNITFANLTAKPAMVMSLTPRSGPAKMKMMKSGMPVGNPDERFEVLVRKSFIRGNCETFHIGLNSPGRIDINHSVIAVDQSLLVVSGDSTGNMPLKNASLDLKLEHVTCLIGNGLIRMESGDQPRELLPVYVSADNNIFATKTVKPLIAMTGNTPPQDFRTSLLRWAGSTNFYDRFKTIWLIESTAGSAMPENIDFTGWKTQWAETEVGPSSGGVAWARSWSELSFAKLTLLDLRLDTRVDREKFPAATAANNGSAVGADLSTLRDFPAKQKLVTPISE